MIKMCMCHTLSSCTGKQTVIASSNSLSWYRIYTADSGKTGHGEWLASRCTYQAMYVYMYRVPCDYHVIIITYIVRQLHLQGRASKGHNFARARSTID